MSKILQNLTIAASIAMAGLPTLALATSAHAAPYAIQVGDLNLGDAKDQSVLKQRVNTAAANVCSTLGAPVGTLIENRTACKDAVRAEAMEKLAALTTASAGSR